MAQSPEEKNAALREASWRRHAALARATELPTHAVKYLHIPTIVNERKQPALNAGYSEKDIAAFFAANEFALLQKFCRWGITRAKLQQLVALKELSAEKLSREPLVAQCKRIDALLNELDDADPRVEAMLHVIKPNVLKAVPAPLVSAGANAMPSPLVSPEARAGDILATLDSMEIPNSQPTFITAPPGTTLTQFDFADVALYRTNGSKATFELEREGTTSSQSFAQRIVQALQRFVQWIASCIAQWTASLFSSKSYAYEKLTLLPVHTPAARTDTAQPTELEPGCFALLSTPKPGHNMPVHTVYTQAAMQL